MKRKLLMAVTVLFCLALLTACGDKSSDYAGDGNAETGNVETNNAETGNAGTDNTETGYAEDGYAEGRLNDTMHTYFFDYTVNSAYLCDSYEGYVPSQEGYQLLVADVTVQNTHQQSIPMFDTDFQVQWSSDADDAYDVPITYYVDAVSDQQLPTEYELAVDETRTGLLVFEVPEGEKDFSISYLEVFDDGTEGDVFFVFFSAEEQA